MVVKRLGAKPDTVVIEGATAGSLALSVIELLFFLLLDKCGFYFAQAGTIRDSSLCVNVCVMQKCVKAQVFVSDR